VTQNTNIRTVNGVEEWFAPGRGWYSRAFKGNQYVGGFNEAIAVGEAARAFGQIVGVAGATLSAGSLYLDAMHGDYWGAAGHALDMTVSLAGTFGGPMLTAASVAYFGAGLALCN
jgi:hypothetical protein